MSRRVHRCFGTGLKIDRHAGFCTPKLRAKREGVVAHLGLVGDHKRRLPDDRLGLYLSLQPSPTVESGFVRRWATSCVSGESFPWSSMLTVVGSICRIHVEASGLAEGAPCASSSGIPLKAPKQRSRTSRRNVHVSTGFGLKIDQSAGFCTPKLRAKREGLQSQAPERSAKRGR